MYGLAVGGMGRWENIMGVAGQAGTLSCPDMVKSLIPLEQKVHINPPISKLHWSWCFYYSNRKETNCLVFTRVALKLEVQEEKPEWAAQKRLLVGNIRLSTLPSWWAPRTMV